MLGSRLALVEVLDASLARLLLHFAFERGVEMVLNVVVRSAVEKSRYFGPPVSEFLVQLENFLVFLFSPAVLFYVWVEMIVPALAALLSDATLNIVSDLAPILSAVDANLIDQPPIFLFSPGTLHHLWVKNFLPPVKALHVRAVLQALSNTFPILGAHLSYQFSEALVLHSRIK